MSGAYDDTNRQVIPRWYSYRVACIMGDLEPQRVRETPKFQSPDAFGQKILDWRETRTIRQAVDLIGTALICGDTESRDVREAADFVLTAREDLPALAREIAQGVTMEPEHRKILKVQVDVNVLKHHTEIARLKVLVRRYPRNAIAWSDMAFHYTLLGQKVHAERCMNLAISIAGDNRFILRSAARFFLHIGKPDQSLFYLRRTGLAQVDPWVVSAEIAISEGIDDNASLVKKARSMVSNADLSPWALNELAATLSTLEALHGSRRKSKRLLAQALRQPNENTVAQAEWLAPTLNQPVARPQKKVLAAYEADARLHLREGDYNKALECAMEWFKFQPFTSRPAVLASYIASVCLEDYHQAISVIKEAEAASCESFLLRNNHAFALASLDRAAEAKDVLSNVVAEEISVRERNTYLATMGLIEFRRGNLAEGRSLYGKAISGFKELKNLRSAAIATFFWAREETAVHGESAKHALEEATRLVEEHEVKELLKHVKTLASQG